MTLDIAHIVSSSMSLNLLVIMLFIQIVLRLSRLYNRQNYAVTSQNLFLEGNRLDSGSLNWREVMRYTSISQNPDKNKENP